MTTEKLTNIRTSSLLMSADQIPSAFGALSEQRGDGLSLGLMTTARRAGGGAKRRSMKLIARKTVRQEQKTSAAVRAVSQFVTHSDIRSSFTSRRISKPLQSSHALPKNPKHIEQPQLTSGPTRPGWTRHRPTSHGPVRRTKSRDRLTETRAAAQPMVPIVQG
jgi:hypothetical protein